MIVIHGQALEEPEVAVDLPPLFFAPVRVGVLLSRCEEHARVSLVGKQREQGPALHMSWRQW